MKRPIIVVLLALVLQSLIIPKAATANPEGSADPAPIYPLSNIHVHNILAGQFKYAKTIDMTNANDRTKIPNASFDFELHTIPEGKEAEYGLGNITPPNNYNGPADNSIIKGNLGAESIPFSKVTFSETDKYDEKLTNLMTEYANPLYVLNHILKYDYGIVTGEKNSQHSSISRPPTTEDIQRLGLNPNNWPNGWPNDTVSWHCPFDMSEYGEVEVNESCESLLQHDFNTFDYNKIYKIYARFPSFFAYSYNRELITYRNMDANNKYLSVSKPLFNHVEYKKAVEYITELPQDYVSHADDTVLRFILKERSSSDPQISTDTNEKILDIYKGNILIFNNIFEAEQFYKILMYPIPNVIPTVPSTSTCGYPDYLSLYRKDLPPVNFTNSFIKKPENNITKVSVQKEWKSMRYGIPVESIEAELYKNSVPTGIKKTLSKNTGWKATFDNLEIRDKNTNKTNVYSVKEIGESDNKITYSNRSFTVSYETLSPNNFVIKNTERTPKLKKLSNSGYDTNVLNYIVMFLIIGAVIFPLSRKYKS